MTILLARIVPRDQLVALHAPIGEVEWPGTVEHIETTIAPRLPLIMAKAACGKSLLDRVDQRAGGPWTGVGARPVHDLPLLQKLCSARFGGIVIAIDCPFYLLHRPSQLRLGFPERTSN